MEWLIEYSQRYKTFGQTAIVKLQLRIRSKWIKPGH